MATPRPTLRLLPHEDAALRTLYRTYKITIDQYLQRPDDLQLLVTSFNNLTGRSDSAPDLLHYMISRRKKKKWERLGRDTAGSPQRPQVSLTEEELRHLDAIHEELQVASDAYALNPEAAKRLKDEFARRTGRVMPPMILAAAMIRRRKDGALATLKPRPDGDDLGFSDMDQVAK